VSVRGAKDRERRVGLTVTANLPVAEGGERPRGVTAYAFSSGGRLLARQELDENGTATLGLSESNVARAVRVLVGPVVEDQDVPLAELRRRGAIEHHVRLGPRDFDVKIELPVDLGDLLCWFRSRCVVRGTLVKREFSGGVLLELPVCGAEVEVYEVDPLPIIIAKLPDLEIERIRDIIINPPPPPPPPIDGPGGPFPPPGPGPDPAPFHARAAMASDVGTARAMVEAIPLAAPVAVASDLQLLARTTDTAQFRRALPNYASVVQYLLCFYFPVTTHLVATATTDECGHFQTSFYRGCNNPDAPDLYFKAKQSYGYFTLPIYAPTPISCHTHWNYVCGTEVTLATTSPFAKTCPPCQPVIAPNNWVLVMAVGNLPLSRIHGASVPLQASTTPANLGLTDSGAPFGGLLRLRAEFDNSLRDDLGVQYYRVSYRQGTSGPFIPLNGTVNRHYTHEVAGDLVLEAYNLGPKVVGGAADLFEIPPALPPIGQWSYPDAVEDLTSAKFPSTLLAPAADDGLYQLKLDLFDTAGAPVDIAVKGIKYRVPAVTSFSGDIDTDDAATLGLISGNSFILTLHVDNNTCAAAIAAPTLGGIAADDGCGVLEYTSAASSVTIAYTASHPKGFATYGFGLTRGINPVTPPSVGPGIPATGTVSTSHPVSALLGGCTVAGFAENLYVAAMATDGWSRQSAYDASAVRAFVLAPEGI
jgi:hypothetical protein